MNDVVILASFIQEEAGMPAEDAKVSACFHNRLESDDPQWQSISWNPMPAAIS